MHVISSYRDNAPPHTHTNITPTHPQTGPITITIHRAAASAKFNKPLLIQEFWHPSYYATTAYRIVKRRPGDGVLVVTIVVR